MYAYVFREYNSQMMSMAPPQDKSDFIKKTIKYYQEFKDTYDIIIGVKELEWLWVTVNPIPTITIDQFKLIVEKFIKKKQIFHYYYTFEQRSPTEENMGLGLHVHLLFNYTNKTQSIKDMVNGHFKQCVQHPMHIHIRRCPTAFMNDKITYMLGEKTGEGKLQKVEIDKLWKIKHSIQFNYKSAYFFEN